MPTQGSIDPTCSIVFELELDEPDVMRRPPRRRTDHLFAAPQIAFGLAAGVSAAVGALAVVAVAAGARLAPDHTRALGFAALIAADLALVLATLGLRGRRGNPATPGLISP